MDQRAHAVSVAHPTRRLLSLRREAGLEARPATNQIQRADDEYVTLGDDEAGSICELFLHMASNEAEDDEGAAELNDHFVSCVAAGREAWGEPFLLEAGDDPTATWRLPEDMFAQVTGGFTAVLFRFFTLEGRWYSSLETGCRL